MFGPGLTVLWQADLSYPAAWAVAALVYATLVSFSRLYLGVHSLLDVVAGALLGLLTCVLVLVGGPALRLLFLSSAPALALAAALGVHVAAVLLYPALPGVSTTYRDTCSILGVSLGVWWAARLTPLLLSGLPLAGLGSVGLPVWGGRVVVGLLAVGAGHALLRVVVRRLLAGLWPRSNKPLDQQMRFVAATKFVSYIGIGFNSLGFVPLIFYWLGLY